MILQALHALHGRLKDDPEYELAPSGYSLQKISFKAVLHPDGRLFEIQSAQVGGRPRQERVLGAGKPSGSGLNPCFLWDNTGYMLGFKPGETDTARNRATFEAFREKHLGLEAEIPSKAYAAVCEFLRSWAPEQASNWPVLTETKSGFGVFQIVGEASFVHQDPCIDDWWRKHTTATGKHGPEGQCLLTGKWAPLARLQPMIKGVAGGNAQAPLVGFNDPAHWSFGKEQSFNAPVSEEAAEQYGAALNALLDGPRRGKHRMLLGDATVAFWTERPCPAEDVFAQFAERGADATVRDGQAQDPALLRKLEIFLDALRQGVEKYGDVAENASQTRFYLLGLSPNQGRIAVRFFLQGSVRDLLDNLRRHHRDIAVERQFGIGAKKPDPEFPPAWRLLAQTVRESKDIPPNLEAPLMRAIIGGGRYPDGLFAGVIRRIRADRQIDYLRACVIKGWLVRNQGKEVPMSLDPDRPDPAYRLGRLFAALEKAQEDALGNVNASIRDRFYSAASATPGSVFPRLLRTYQHHLAKLEVGRKIAREKLVQEILGPLDGFPAHMSLADQGLFALGYYHQRQAFFKKRETETLNENEGAKE